MDDVSDRDSGRAGRAETGSVFTLSGMTLGRYRLVEKLGQGGMAQVYRAFDPDLERYVALKILHPHLTGDETFSRRFRREAQAIAALEHPSVLRVYDFGVEGELAYLVMELVPGQSLKARLHDLDRRGERVPLAEACELVAAIGDGLAYAHGQGIVHRDVKPSNVLLAESGHPVLADFGIARMVDATAITESGGTMGTPAYMSPEQGQGEPGDSRADIYALGVLLYQLCTGQVPFQADTPYAVILKHITAPLPAPRDVRPDLPEAVERVILKALAKAPEDRFQSASQMASSLRRAQAGDAVLPAESGSRSDEGDAARVPAAMWALMALLAAAAVAFLTGPLWGGWLTRPQSTSSAGQAAVAAGALTYAGGEAAVDTWLNPDLPDDVWHDFDLVHLQGPLTPDRLLFRFDLASPTDGAAIARSDEAAVVSATLTVRVELWGEESFPGAAVAYRVLTPWEADTASYASPWSGPGLIAGVDYDPTPLDVVPVPDEGLLVFDVTEALRAWVERGEPNHGILVMMSEDSHNQAHHWVYMSEQPDPADRPTLRVGYGATR